jgi:glutamate-1-semialdehyde aminotransferase
MAENKSAQQVREITDKLEQGIKELFESERFKEYLRTMSKFYQLFIQQHPAHRHAEAGGYLCCRIYLMAAQL